MTNVVVLIGRLARPATLRQLPSGSTLVEYQLTVPRPGARAESVPVVWEDPPPSAVDHGTDDEVVVVGRVRRRFFRTASRTESRTEVVAEKVVAAKQAKRVHAALAAAQARITEAQALGDPLLGRNRGVPSRARLDPPVAPVWRQQWLEFFSLHWAYSPEVVQALLPPELTVDTFDGRAWVGLTPLLMNDVAPRGVPALPWLGRFPEINLRTYVRAPDGEDGLWFFSLEAARLPFVLAARSLYGVPYVWASMRIERPEERVRRWESRRRWPGSTGALVDVTLEAGEPIPEGDITEKDMWLTGRWRAYSVHPVAGLLTTDVGHPPWPLHRARVRHLEETVLAAAGLPPRADPPLVHFSPGVDIRLGLPRPVRAEEAAGASGGR